MGACKCGSYAINPREHGREPGIDLDKCDVCYWRDRAAIPDPCEWLQDEWDSSWETSCGNKFEIIDGTPEDNGMRFCTYCGGKLEAICSTRR